MKLTRLKKVLSIIIFMSIILSMVAVVVQGASNIAQGTSGTCTWVIDSQGNLTIKPTNGREGTLENTDENSSTGAPWYEYREQIKTVKFEGKVYAGEICRGLFYNCINLTDIDFTNFDTSNVTNMQAMFTHCSSLKRLDASNFKTNNVTTMRSIFHSCTSLEYLNISSWNTGNVTDMYAMFYNCPLLTKLDVSNFNTSNVTTMYAMFYNCKLLTELDVSNFNTSNVTTMTYMFRNCRNLTELDINNFDTTNVTEIELMFYGCNLLGKIDLSELNTSSLTNTSNAIPLGIWEKQENGIEYTANEIANINGIENLRGTYIKTSMTSLENDALITYKLDLDSKERIITINNEENIRKENNAIYYILPEEANSADYLLDASIEIIYKDAAMKADKTVNDVKITINNMHIYDFQKTLGTNKIYLELYYENTIFDGIWLSNRIYNASLASTGKAEKVKYDVTVQVIDDQGIPQEGTFLLTAYDIDVPDNAGIYDSDFSEGVNLGEGFNEDTVTFSRDTCLTKIGNRVRGTRSDKGTEASAFLVMGNSNGATYTWTAGRSCATDFLNGYNPNFVQINKIDDKGSKVVGARLALYKGNNLIQEWETTEEARYLFLNPGIYKLKENVTPEGYKTAEEKSIYVDISSENVVVNMIDERKDSRVIIHHYIEGTTSPVSLVNGKLAEDETIEGKIGDRYNSRKANISENYELIEVPQNATGVMGEDEIEVTYYYRKKQGTVIVKYIDKDTGKEIEETEIIKDDLGVEYNAQAKEIKGYKLIKEDLPKDSKGRISEGTKNITYYYSKKVFNLKVEKSITGLIIDGEEQKIKNKDIAKIEVKASDVDTKNAEIRYEIKVTNTSEVEGSTIIQETIPQGLKINPDQNRDWTINGNVATLKTDIIKPGESVTYEVLLKWENSSTNFGGMETITRLIDFNNKEELADSIIEDNKDNAIVVIEVKTGQEIKKAIILLPKYILIILTIIILKRKNNRKI